MTPIRIATRATHWKEVPNPKGTLTKTWIPTSSDDPMSSRMSIMDFNSAEEIVLPPIEMEHFQKAKATIKPSVNKEDLEIQERFTQLYGMLGSDTQQSAELPLISENQVQQEDQNALREKEELSLMKTCTDMTNKFEFLKKRRREEKRLIPEQ